MIEHAYIDTSIVLRTILGEKASYKKLGNINHLYSSSLLRVEASRTLHRLHIQDSWDDQEIAIRTLLLQRMLESIEEIPLQPAILKRASEPFSIVIKTLDALHISSALLLNDFLKASLVFLTHDSKQALAAQSCGLQTN